MKVIFLFLSFFLCFSAQAQPSPFDLAPKITISNKVLANVAGTNISVFDLVKKMDLFLMENYPLEAANPQARYQFYSTQWKRILQQMIDQRLILADAESKDVKVSEGDIREEMQRRFGPQVISNLKKANLSYDEAKELIRNEKITQKMNWFYVHSKVIQNVTSKEIKKAYQDFASQNPSKEYWTYQVINFKSDDSAPLDAAVVLTRSTLSTSQLPLEQCINQLQEKQTVPQSIEVSVSKEFMTEVRELSPKYKNILAALKPGEYSLPIKEQKSNAISSKILLLKAKKIESIPSFQDMLPTLKNELMQKEFEKQNRYYIEKLRHRFGYTQTNLMQEMASDFQPFHIN
ncbi:MAG: hypothetical protein ACOVOR_03840 [Rhabdochlamydiaceae bacterium]